MKITFFSTKPYDCEVFDRINQDFGYRLEYFESYLDLSTINLIDQSDAVCAFVNDTLDASVIEALAERQVKYVAMRCAGFNNVDLEAAKKFEVRVCRVPAYSPEAVAEHALALILTLARKTHKAFNRVREQNFSLNGLTGITLYRKTIGVVGTGNIGAAFARIAKGLGCEVIAFDIQQKPELVAMGVTYVSLEELFSRSDIISLHCPLMESTHYIINRDAIARMKKGVMLINTSRGGLIDTGAVIQGLYSKQIGHLGIDVYEQEEKLFFRDLSQTILEDETLQMLMGFPNVLISAHQAFLTYEALDQIATTTLTNLRALAAGEVPLTPAALLA